MEIRLDPSSLATCDKTENLHSLPCRINHNAVANIPAYFVVTPADGTVPRRLRRNVPWPSATGPKDAPARSFQETDPPPSRSDDENNPSDDDKHHESDTRQWTATHRFSSMTVWATGQAPQRDANPYLMAMEWLEVATIVSVFLSVFP
ncbi:hypothetical protein BC936DRAFT_143799 [Jimgerdemannia flammicorona]|uniref:Uncharacterized protein n=2 Tax=Jimgerdemannia flammicorona TaxID=994334 RepID=A0A433QZH7_9FUNG|nr:hypothetical protein BC936DRAFT_143799 [Jimgerdemannia flammicorona]RUS35188.1 hypothetical protein BC938DRAFT_474396 [Jimgerdemannia flammicorona]